jgi:hypothetical protein
MSGGSTHARREHRPWKINIYSNECTEHFNTDACTHTCSTKAREKLQLYPVDMKDERNVPQ